MSTCPNMVSVNFIWSEFLVLLSIQTGISPSIWPHEFCPEPVYQLLELKQKSRGKLNFTLPNCPAY